jgi:hypothetical protein
MLEIWTPTAVRKELAFAFRVLHATTGRVGHKALKAAMPDYEYSAADLNIQYLAEVEAKKRGETTLRDRLVTRFRPSSQEIERAHVVLLGSSHMRPWLRLADGYPLHRDFLVEAVLAAARGVGDRRLCRERGWNLSTFQRHRDHAAGVIATHLNRHGVRPWR